jgi:hypothetical protein
MNIDYDPFPHGGTMAAGAPPGGSPDPPSGPWGPVRGPFANALVTEVNDATIERMAEYDREPPPPPIPKPLDSHLL